jgi:biopolymer transport protein ExbB/TolQ
LLALLVLAVMIYALVFGVWWRGMKIGRGVRAGDWLARLECGSGLASQAAMLGRRELEREFAAFELDELAWVERRIPFLTVLIAAAPLLGLLGTVAGMLISFDGLAGSMGGEPIDTISTGISKALVTTQAGLVIAVPAAFFLALLKRQAESTHLELQRQLHEQLAIMGGSKA